MRAEAAWAHFDGIVISAARSDLAALVDPECDVKIGSGFPDALGAAVLGRSPGRRSVPGAANVLRPGGPLAWQIPASEAAHNAAAGGRSRPEAADPELTTHSTTGELWNSAEGTYSRQLGGEWG